MSHYAQMKVMFQQRNENELVSSLKQIFGDVEVHKEATDLMTYFDRSATEQKQEDLHAEPCHIVVRRPALAKRKGVDHMAFNDLGYRRNAAGGYDVFIDEAGVKKADIGLVAQEYSLKVAEKNLKAKGYGYKRIQLEDSSVRLEATRFMPTR